MYLTNNYLCFFAHMPSREDQVLKSGSLQKKARRTKRWIKHWFILKNDALSWYQSSSDPYFPHGIVDLRYAISCEARQEREIRIRTNQKSITLYADSTLSRDEWVKSIRKVMFKAQNMGDSVKIAIPYAAILDVEKSSAIDFSETIEVKVVDKDEPYSVDSYFFAYFRELPVALEQIRDAVRTTRQHTTQETSPPVVLDTTLTKPSHLDHIVTSPSSVSSPDDIHRASSTSTPFRLPSILRTLRSTSDARQVTRPASPPSPTREPGDDYTHITRKGGSSFVPIVTSPATGAPPASSAVPGSGRGAPVSTTQHTYPPSTSPASTVRERPIPPTSTSWSVGVPSWLKTTGRRVSSTNSTDDGSIVPPVSEVLSARSISSAGSRGFSGGDLAFSVLDSPDFHVDVEMVEKFHTAFAFDDKEVLLGCKFKILLVELVQCLGFDC